MNELVLAVSWYAVFLFSLTVHEAAHAWAAMRGGDLTAYRGGQVSLDPLPHVRREPFGTVLVPFLSFAFSGWMIGWASTPYDPRWAYAHPRRAAWMALAGPLANFGLVVLAMLLIRVGLAAGVFAAPASIGFTEVVSAPAGGAWAAAALCLSILFTLNLLLFVFNLIPFPPLDGAGVLGLLLPEDAGRRLQALTSRPQFAFVGLLIAWFAIGPIFRPVRLLAIGLLYPEASYR